jgi:hypothetical protein
MTEHHSEPNAAVEAFDITRTYGVGDTAVEALSWDRRDPASRR